MRKRLVHTSASGPAEQPLADAIEPLLAVEDERRFVDAVAFQPAHVDDDLRRRSGRGDVIRQVHAHVVEQVVVVGFDLQTHALHFEVDALHDRLLGSAAGACRCSMTLGVHPGANLQHAVVLVLEIERQRLIEQETEQGTVGAAMPDDQDGVAGMVQAHVRRECGDALAQFGVGFAAGGAEMQRIAPARFPQRANPLPRRRRPAEYPSRMP